MRRYLGLVAGLLAGACAPAPRVAAPSPLAATLAVEVVGDTAWLTLNVTNATTADVLLEYRTAQRYDFEVRRASGEVLWRWSEGRLFAEVVSEVRLGAGETVRHREWWRVPGAGEYVAVGRLTAQNERVELSAPFRVAGEAEPGR